MKHLILFFAVLAMYACSQPQEIFDMIDWQGHRGARGVYPENTWAAFQYAIDQNMSTLEMDVIISKDGKVVLSHEPFLNHKICLDSSGNSISEEEEKTWNLYQLTYQELEKCDCGSVQNPDFPQQTPVSAPKPLLKDIISKTIMYCEKEGKELPSMNVEIKYKDGMQNIFHPDIAQYSKLVYEVLNSDYPQEKWNIQSFDSDVLKYFHQQYPQVRLAALVYSSGDWKAQFEELGFTPEIYSPYFQLVNKQMVSELHENGVKIIPWTVNEEDEARRLLRLGVDGIITDYPQLADKFHDNP